MATRVVGASSGSLEAVDLGKRTQREVKGYTTVHRIAEFVLGCGICVGCYFAFDFIASSDELPVAAAVIIAMCATPAAGWGLVLVGESMLVPSGVPVEDTFLR